MTTVVIYEQVELEALRYVKEEELFLYPCPCGDEFTFYIEDLMNDVWISTCPSCSLNVELVCTKEKLEAFIQSH